MANQLTEKQSRVLIIDRIGRQPTRTRVRSMGVDGMKHEMILRTSTVSGFHRYSLQNSCKNLLCFARYSNNGDSACLLDLGAKKVIALPEHQHPSPESVTSFFGLGFDSRLNQHKTVRIEVGADTDSDGVFNHVISAQVNTLGEDGWKPVLGELPNGSIFGKPLALEASGAMVWADFPQIPALNGRRRSAAATVFNLAEEKFSTVPLPQRIQVGHLVALNGRLCAVDLSSNQSIQIWSLQDLYAESSAWGSLCRIKMRSPSGEADHGRTRVLGELENGELLLESYGAYFVYRAATERLDYLHLPVATDPASEVHCYGGEL